LKEVGQLPINKLAIDRLNGFVLTEVQKSISVLRLSDSAKNTAHRQYAAR